MLNPKIEQQLGMIRVRVESEVEAPTAIAVTSANDNDGTTVVARGLAESLAASGQRTLFVDAGGDQAAVRSVPNFAALASLDIDMYVAKGGPGEPDVLRLAGPAIAQSGSVEAVRAALVRLNETYRYILIDAAAAASDAVSLMFVSAADVVLIALRKGRSSTPTDAELVALLKTAQANVLGVVTPESWAINAFKHPTKSSSRSHRPVRIDEASNVVKTLSSPLI